jgi:hypothetical protein
MIGFLTPLLELLNPKNGLFLPKVSHFDPLLAQFVPDTRR